MRPAHRIDPPLTDFAQAVIRKGNVVWDVGANIGLFTFTASGLVGSEGQVIAVEPDTWLVDQLRRSARLNPDLGPVDVVPVAASDTGGVAAFHIARSSRATNYLEGAGSTVTGGSRERQQVPTMTLDELASFFPLPQVLKIDVERAELAVCHGAQRVLASHPWILIEVGADAAAIGRILTGHDYSLLDALNLEVIEQPSYLTVAVPPTIPIHAAQKQLHASRNGNRLAPN